jgi:hypothetical protein
MATSPAERKFTGAKNAPGTWHRIVNLIPPCSTFIEPFAGTAAITRHLRPARETILIDKIDRAPLRDLARKGKGIRYVVGDALQFLDGYRYRGGEVVYCDPPYLLAARLQRGKHYYENEMTDQDHARLLKILRSINCRVLLSGYRSPLYDEMLCDWQREEFEVMTRGGTKAIEVLWWNYPRPVTLHDYRYVGEDWKARYNLRRKIRRAVADLASMRALERNALFAALVETVGAAALKSVVERDAPENSRLAPKITLPGDTRAQKPVAVLFAREDSIYKTFPGVDVWDKARDARNWRGGAPVVAHPPCRAWGSLKGLAKPEPGEKDLALTAVRLVQQWGGVLEHPAASGLWAAAQLPEPGARDTCGGFTIEAPQWIFGHRAEKKTRFYVCGCEPAELPELPEREGIVTHVVNASNGIRAGDQNYRKSVSHEEREATPPAAAAWLLEVARRCQSRAAALAGNGEEDRPTKTGEAGLPNPKRRGAPAAIRDRRDCALPLAGSGEGYSSEKIIAAFVHARESMAKGGHLYEGCNSFAEQIELNGKPHVVRVEVINIAQDARDQEMAPKRKHHRQPTPALAGSGEARA